MAAIYARVSSEQQREENTIASQTVWLIEFAKGHNLEVPEEWVFEDEGYSGAILERPGLERVRDLAAEGQIQVVLAYAPVRMTLIPGRTLAASTNEMPPLIVETKLRAVPTDGKATGSEVTSPRKILLVQC